MKLPRLFILVPICGALLLVGSPAISRDLQSEIETNRASLSGTYGTAGLIRLLKSIEKADLVVCTNAPEPSHDLPGFVGFISGGDVTNLIDTISMMKPFPFNTLHEIPDMKLYFFSGTNCVGMAKIAADLLESEDGSLYEDKTGVIRGIYAHWEKLLEQRSEEVSEKVAKPEEIAKRIAELDRERKANQTNRASH